MAAWVGTLSKGSESNWALCKEYRLWGTGGTSAVNVASGDDLFVWMAGQGWLAHCRATRPAHPPASGERLPWPDSKKYRYVFPITVVSEAAVPHWMPGAQLLTDVGLPTIQLRQFPRLEEPAAALLRRLLGS